MTYISSLDAADFIVAVPRSICNKRVYLYM